MPKDLTVLFYPKSVAVVGASRSPQKVGGIVLKNIIESGFKGDVFPVNPNAKKLNKLKCFKSLEYISQTPDLVVIAVPASIVSEIIDQAGKKGVKNAVVISAGFKETGEEGAKLEETLKETAKKHNINLLGPNCLGFVNNMAPINVTFSQPVNKTGNLRFITQSGAIASSLFDWFSSSDLGFSEFVTLGNKADLNENDILEYFYSQSKEKISTLNGADDNNGISNVNPIGLYLESISSGSQFLNITKKITKRDPVLVIKPGKTPAAAKAMQSHTGAIAGEDAVLEAVLEQAGAIRCQSLEDFFDLSRAFAWENTPDGPKVAVISNAGGPAVISADAVVTEGLELTEFDDKTKKKLTEILPRSASIINPVDVLGDALADRYEEAAEVILESDVAARKEKSSGDGLGSGSDSGSGGDTPGSTGESGDTPSGSQTDALLFILTPQIMTQIEKTAEIIGKLSNKYHKPIFCSFIGGKLISEGEEILNKYKIPSFRYPERAIKAIGSMWKWRKSQIESASEDQAGSKEEKTIHLLDTGNVIRRTIQQAVNANQKTLDNIQVNEIFKSIGVSTPETIMAGDLKEAEGFAQKNGWPLVLKFSSPGLLHKREVGGVITDILNKDQLDDAWHKLERKKEQLDEKIKSQMSFQVQKDISGDVEVIIGVRRDLTFGSVLLFGAGGTYAELISDRNLHLLPIDLTEAKKLVKKSKVYSVLKGNKEEPPYALEKIYELIVRIAKLAESMPEATDIEVNPAIVTLNDVWAVDGKIVLQEAEKKPVGAGADDANDTGDAKVQKGPKYMVATCTKQETLATQFHYYEFEAEEALDFKPGQYISVRVAKDAVRAYSIATYADKKHFSLLVDIRPGGPGSKFFENLKPGDKMTYLGSFGNFTLNLDDGAEQLLFLGTGSGASALRCMIDGALRDFGVKKPIKLYFGLTHVEEIFWQDHFEELKKKYPNFDYDISICEPDETWPKPGCFITKPLGEEFKDASNCAAYLCGHRAMIADATELLLKNGCPKERIYTERFV